MVWSNRSMVPTSFTRSFLLSATRTPNCPFARTGKMIGYFASWIGIGLLVPQRMSMDTTLLIKYTWQLKGDSPLKGRFTSLLINGIFCVWRVYLPAVNKSKALPSLKNKASCDSATISCESVLKSSPGNFQTNVSLSPEYLITSNTCMSFPPFTNYNSKKSIDFG